MKRFLLIVLFLVVMALGAPSTKNPTQSSTKTHEFEELNPIDYRVCCTGQKDGTMECHGCDFAKPQDFRICCTLYNGTMSCHGC
ncbi:hypothetical protein L3Y34_015941 [Caenorhabditis briggsae]|uniref:Uncharacterized protein n=1 Tax=Caenorhabditis briggsae TaxID=6238 RepID=A0AAE9J004_CAEBR|nr:hypothetical protein L3Y34_015941 [Caenorhabditis briggsae]